MGRKQHNKGRPTAETRVKKSLKNESIINSDDEEFYVGENRSVSKQDGDEIDEFYAKKDRILLSGHQKESDSEEEHVYALSATESDSESGDENGVLSLEKVNDMVARFIKKKELDSDLEDGGDQDDLPDAKAWGRKRQDFYNTDFVDKDMGALSEKDKEIARMEEEEAREIQKRLAHEVDEDAFGLEDLRAPEVDKDETVKKSSKQHIEVDFSKLPNKKLVKMVSEESPELQVLLDDCKAKLRELDTEVTPMLELLRDGRLPSGSFAENYLLLRYNILISYTTNICFYLSLKAKRVNIRNHPIVKRLSQFKKLIMELDRTRTRLLPQIQGILERAQNGKELKMKSISSNKTKRAALEEVWNSSSDKEFYVLEEEDAENPEMFLPGRGSKTGKGLLSAAEKEIMKLYDDMTLHTAKRAKKNHVDSRSIGNVGDNKDEPLKEEAIFGDTDSENDEPVFKAGRDDFDHDQDHEEDEIDTQEKKTIETGEESGDADENDGEDRRAINFQIAKNKGLTPHRAKCMRNPRVRHRMKFRKANIRRKGQVRAMRDEAQRRYSGETSGINARVIKSVKLH
ncbi:something about silencing protein 10-like [Tropilaelaps mercedesae]|uniref:Something about silencing protein 10-like n=1 Tax=Tropilaelaps mercedesae TaxID=418985 RepID=A0A1V9Y0Y3_9ACAR|nr:something about silencing protein 10-like [Tropilaelaps mercedesae]